MPHWSGLLIIGVIVLLIFGGRGKISSIMGDIGDHICGSKRSAATYADDWSMDGPNSCYGK